MTRDRVVSFLRDGMLVFFKRAVIQRQKLFTAQADQIMPVTGVMTSFSITPIMTLTRLGESQICGSLCPSAKVRSGYTADTFFVQRFLSIILEEISVFW